MRAVREKPQRRQAWRFATATAVMLMLVVAVFAESVHRARQHRIEALRAEQQRIATELRQVKAMADEAQPVVVFENGKSNTRVIVDLNQRANLVY